MRVCPQCGYKDDPLWKPLFWRLYWDYMPQTDYTGSIPMKLERKYCEEGNFYYHFEDTYYYYRVGGKTRRMIVRFPKGYESMVNRKLYEKTPSEKGFPDIYQQKLFAVKKT